MKWVEIVEIIHSSLILMLDRVATRVLVYSQNMS